MHKYLIMASTLARLLCITIIIYTIDKSIMRIHVNCEVVHHVRHFNHHNRHRVEHKQKDSFQKEHSHFMDGSSVSRSTINSNKNLSISAVVNRYENLHRRRSSDGRMTIKLPDKSATIVQKEPSSDTLLQILSTPSHSALRRITSKADSKSPPPFLLAELSSQREADNGDYDGTDESTEGENFDTQIADNRDTSKNGGIKCPKCHGTTNVHVSEEELTELRIEYVKNQILQKLRLKERPTVAIADLPRPLYEGTTIHDGDVGSQSKELDDYYARTSQKFIFMEEERIHCDRTGSSAPAEGTSRNVCFQFQIDDDIEDIDVSTAEIWIYKNDFVISKTEQKQQFTVSEVNSIESDNHKENVNSSLPDASPIAVQSVGIEAGWIKIDIAQTTKQWFSRRHLSHIIRISCEQCQLNRNDTDLLSIEKDYRPFILIDTVSRRRVHRQKRSVNCSEGVTECCREKLYISFKDIGWSDWIMFPSGYDAYFCRGSCSTAASITMSNSYYSSVLRKVIYQRESIGGKALELIPCCTAKKFSSLQLIYVDSNKTAISKTLPNMVVDSCGCT